MKFKMQSYFFKSILGKNRDDDFNLKQKTYVHYDKIM